jgi:S1-C subfamily serine protease
MNASWVFLLVMVLAACGGSAAPQVAVHPTPEPTAAPVALADLQQGFVRVIDRTAPEVVQISGSQGLGSGVVFDHRGDVVTNAHVVSGGGPFQVTSASGRAYRARVVGTFALDDIAIVRAAGASLPAASFADSRKLQVGDIVLAIGNPLGLRSSVTNGIVSALGRTVSEPAGPVLPNVIQTSAPINPGNSGGGLVNLSGDVVGIPTLAATDPELGGGAAPGIGFAIPSSVVTDIASQIVAHGHVTNSHRAFLGVHLASGLVNGAVVASVVHDGPAARAGIHAGDTITSINGQAVGSPSDVAAVLATLRPGATVEVKIVRPDGAITEVKVKLGQYPGT